MTEQTRATGERRQSRKTRWLRERRRGFDRRAAVAGCAK